MTEIERILEKGVINEDFLKEEIRNGFLVTTERKKLWAIMLDMTLEFDRVCKEHGLKYFLWGGSLLGAVRHQGIIPWDDDIDVIMPRKDYEKFLLLGDEFKEPYFFQTPYTDPESCYTFAKIRNSNTTGVIDLFRYQKFNHGIWISVFPLDNWKLEGGEEKFNRIKSLSLDCSTFMRMKNPHLSDDNKKRVEGFINRRVNPLKAYEEIFRLTGENQDDACEYVAFDSCTVYSYSRSIFPAEDFANQVWVGVEGFLLPISNGYDRVLTIVYGDYMVFPPVEERGRWHAGTTFNPDIPYMEYLRSILID
ncbi:MAG: LicD family protein [Bacteroidales bacterium]|nr:LicD family protein [Bacteroidales bacterium]